MVTYEFHQKIKDKTVEDLKQLIETVEYCYPEMKNRLDDDEIGIICDVFYEEFAKRGRISDFPRGMDLLFSNGLFSSVGDGIRFDFKCLELNKISLTKFFNYLEIEMMMKRIEKRLKESKKCKVKQFKKRR